MSAIHLRPLQLGSQTGSGLNHEEQLHPDLFPAQISEMLCRRAPRQHQEDVAIHQQEVRQRFHQWHWHLAAAQQALQQHQGLQSAREDQEYCSGDQLMFQRCREPHRHALSKEDPAHNHPDLEGFLCVDGYRQTEALEQAPSQPAHLHHRAVQGDSPHQMKGHLPHLPIVVHQQSGPTATGSLHQHKRQPPNL